MMMMMMTRAVVLTSMMMISTESRRWWLQHTRSLPQNRCLASACNDVIAILLDVGVRLNYAHIARMMTIV